MFLGPDASLILKKVRQRQRAVTVILDGFEAEFLGDRNDVSYIQRSKCHQIRDHRSELQSATICSNTEMRDNLISRNRPLCYQTRLAEPLCINSSIPNRQTCAFVLGYMNWCLCLHQDDGIVYRWMNSTSVMRLQIVESFPGVREVCYKEADLPAVGSPIPSV